MTGMKFNYEFDNKNNSTAKYVIYLITNTISNKYYVGQTRRELRYRWADYKNDLLKPIDVKKRSGSNIKLKRSVQKHFDEQGNTNFLEFTILEIVDMNNINIEEDRTRLLNEREIHHIKEYRKLYGNHRVFNVMDGGNGYYHTEEVKEKLSNDKKGKTYEEIYGEEVAQRKKENMSRSVSGENHPNYGIHLSEETRQKISEGNKGKVLSPETRAKMSESRKGEKNPLFGIPLTEEHKQKLSEAHKGQISLKKDKTNVELYGEERANEIKEKLKESHKGNRNRAKITQFPLVLEGVEYSCLVSPEGIEYRTINNAAEFCRGHNLRPQDFNKLLKRRAKSCSGWKLKIG